jgi:hypothetical protein
MMVADRLPPSMCGSLAAPNGVGRPLSRPATRNAWPTEEIQAVQAISGCMRQAQDEVLANRSVKKLSLRIVLRIR